MLIIERNFDKIKKAIVCSAGLYDLENVLYEVLENKQEKIIVKLEGYDTVQEGFIMRRGFILHVYGDEDDYFYARDIIEGVLLQDDLYIEVNTFLGGSAKLFLDNNVADIYFKNYDEQRAISKDGVECVIHYNSKEHTNRFIQEVADKLIQAYKVERNINA